MQTLGGLRTPPTNTTHKAKTPRKKKKKKKEKRIYAGNIKRFALSFVVAPLPFIFSVPLFFRRTKQIAKTTHGKEEADISYRSCGGILNERDDTGERQLGRDFPTNRGKLVLVAG